MAGGVKETELDADVIDGNAPEVCPSVQMCKHPACTCTCVNSVCASVCRMYVCMYVCMYVHMCLCVNVCVYRILHVNSTFRGSTYRYTLVPSVVLQVYTSTFSGSTGIY